MNEKEKREQLRKFLQSCVNGELAFEGENAIEFWEEKCKKKENDDETLGFDIYKLSENDKQLIRDICAEFYAAREQEKSNSENSTLADEKADKIMANHYADRIREIVVKGMDKRWLPQAKEKSSRPKAH